MAKQTDHKIEDRCVNGCICDCCKQEIAENLAIDLVERMKVGLQGKGVKLKPLVYDGGRYVKLMVEHNDELILTLDLNEDALFELLKVAVGWGEGYKRLAEKLGGDKDA